MRVAIVGPFSLHPRGTVSERALPMANVLAKKGYDVFVVVPPYDNPAYSGRIHDVGGVTVYNVHIPMGVPLFKHALIAKKMIALMLKVRPDVVHIIKPKGYSGLTGMALRALGKPVVVDMDDWEGFGGFNDVMDYPFAWKAFFHFQEVQIPRHSRAVTVASKTLESRVTDFGVPRDRIFYVPNGPNHLRYRRGDVYDGSGIRERYGIGDAPLLILYTRFFGLDMGEVVGIFRRIKEEVREAKLMVVGKGRHGEEEVMATLVKRAGVSDSVVFAGWIKAEEIPLHLAAADVALWPYKDTIINRAKCSVKFIEHMIVGNPIVAYDVGETGTYVEDGASGLLVESGNTELFAESLLRVLADEDLRRRLGERARERIWARFGWERLVRGVERAYARALE